MSGAWLAVVVGGVGCYLLKVLGLAVPAHVLEHPAVRRIADRLPIALLAALVAVQVFAGDHRLALDARAAGLAAAVLLLAVRAPFLVVVFGAGAVAALLRAVA